MHWVDEAAQLPLAFAQVREDPLIDQWAVGRYGATARVMMVASGGCTAAALATQPCAMLHLVDPNPAQIALSRLKLELLSRPHALRMVLLGHAAMPAPERMVKLDSVLNHLGLPLSLLGPVEFVSAVGPDHAGRLERLFAELTRQLSGVKGALATLLTSGDRAAQGGLAATGTPLGDAMNAAFENVFALPNLVQLFGEAVTRNAAEPFATHFLKRTRAALAAFPAVRNPFLWQMLAGSFPPGMPNTWLQAETPARMPALQFSVGTINEALAGFVGEFDVVQLSNILDWLSEEDAMETLELAYHALRPNGCVVIRQLNSRLNLNSFTGFEWMHDEAQSWHKRDRSFIHQALYFGVRQF
jgi:S-adenosylmethionine-diacylglycerol 3-amino-3-carboxypropyl transferase